MYPSFFAVHHREPVLGIDFDPDGGLCQDDYEYYTGTGRYTDNVEQDDEGAIVDLVCDDDGNPI
jgi:hypothetical protein